MSEFEESTYQSAPEEIEQPLQQESAVEQQEQQSSPQENVFTVKYNKEEVHVPYEQAPDYIQKGMNYDKVQQRADDYQRQLDRVIQLSGYQNQDELLSALDEFERSQEQAKYEQAGIDPAKFHELVSELPEIQQFRQMQQQQQETQQMQNEANELFAEFPDLKPEQIPAEAWQLKEQRGLTILDAYLRTTYKNIGQQKEQEAIQKLQGNAQSSPGSLGGGDVNHNTNVSNLSAKDFNAMVDQVLRGERKTL